MVVIHSGCLVFFGVVMTFPRLPAMSRMGGFPGYSSIWRAIHWPSKWANHWPWLLTPLSSRYSSAGRENGMLKYLCSAFDGCSLCCFCRLFSAEITVIIHVVYESQSLRSIPISKPLWGLYCKNISKVDITVMLTM